MAVIATVAFVCTFCLVSSKLLQDGPKKRNTGQERGKAEMICDLICNVGSTCSKAKILWIQGLCDCITDVSDGDDHVDEAPAGVTGCPTHRGYRWVASAGICVRFLVRFHNYHRGKALCEAEPGGRIVHLDTKAKIQAIEDIHRKEYVMYSFYIGLNDEPKYPRGDFRWTDGTPVGDSNWGPGQPDNNFNDNCVVTTKQFIWVDLYCSDRVPIICEITSFSHR